MIPAILKAGICHFILWKSSRKNTTVMNSTQFKSTWHTHDTILVLLQIILEYCNTQVLQYLSRQTPTQDLKQTIVYRKLDHKYSHTPTNNPNTIQNKDQRKFN